MTLILLNTLGWLVLQLSIAAVAIRLGPAHLENDNWLFHVHPFEIAFYKRRLHIRRWKGLLPDGGPWVGSNFRKESLQRSDAAYLRQLLIETRRGEAAHWLMLASFPLFFLWNPPWARIVMSLYAILANLPCIIVQRYNRKVVGRIKLRRAAEPR